MYELILLEYILAGDFIWHWATVKIVHMCDEVIIRDNITNVHMMMMIHLTHYSHNKEAFQHVFSCTGAWRNFAKILFMIPAMFYVDSSGNQSNTGGPLGAWPPPKHGCLLLRGGQTVIHRLETHSNCTLLITFSMASSFQFYLTLFHAPLLSVSSCYHMSGNYICTIR